MFDVIRIFTLFYHTAFILYFNTSSTDILHLFSRIWHISLIRNDKINFVFLTYSKNTSLYMLHTSYLSEKISLISYDQNSQIGQSCKKTKKL